MFLFFICLRQTGYTQEMKATPVGKLALNLIIVINSGNKADWDQFIHTSIDLNARDNNPEDLLKKFADFYELTGGVEITSMESGRAPDEAKLLVKSHKKNQSIEMFTRLSRESDEKIIGFIFRLLSGGTENPVSAWPQHSLPEAEIIQEIKNHAEKAFRDDRYSGVILIAKKDRVLLNTAYGMANKEKEIPNNTETKFNLGSMNKMFTSVAIAQLVQAGKISFDDPLLKVFPDYPNPEIAKKITVQELLTHSSGLGDFFKPVFFEHPENYVELSSYLPLFENDTLLFEPGKGWSYSNAGYIVLGLIVEKISGENYFDYVRKHIFIPSGMTHTDSYMKNDMIPNLASGYTFSEAEGKSPKFPVLNTTALPVKGSSAGGGYSTTGDLLRFSQSLLNNQLLHPEYTKITMTGKVDDHHKNSKYAYGFMDITINGKHIIGHNGGAPGINGALYMLPANEYIVIVLGNYSPPAAAELAMDISQFLTLQ